MDEKENTRELVVVDVKRYKKVKEALRDSEERYRQLFENVPIGIYRTTPDGRIIDSNPALIKMLGYDSFADLSSRKLDDGYSDPGFSRAAFIKRLKRDGVIIGLETIWVKKDGSKLHVRENAKLIRSQQGGVFFEGTVEDVTQSRQAAEAQRIRTQQLEVLNCIIASGNMADSLRELLDAILDNVLTPLGFDMASIFMYDAAAKKAQVLAFRGVAKSFFENEKYMSVENMPFSQVLLRGQAVFVDDASSVISDLAQRWKWKTAACVPMLSKGRVVGAINVASCERTAFSPEERNILELIGKESGTLVSKLQTEMELRHSEKYYRTLIDTSPDIIIVLGLDARLITVNQQFLKVGGYFYDEVIGTSTYDFVDGLDRSLLENKTSAFIKKRKASGSNYLFRKKNGESVPLEVAADLLYDDQGKPMGILAIGRDIRERLRSEEQLHFLSSITENISDAIVVTDVEYRITYINKVAEKFFGYRLDELKGKTPEVFNVEPMAAEIQKKVYRTVSRGNTHLGESLNRRKDGSTFYCEYKVMPLKDSQGKIYAYSSLQRDVSERKEAEAKLLAYQEQLRALSSEMLLVEERERRRIASELHDQIGQSLALCKLKITALEKSMTAAAWKAELAAIRQMLDSCIQDARSLIFDLSPPVLYELGLNAALEWLAERIQEQFKIPVEFENRFGDPQLDNDQQVILFQVVRELLINVGKHSEASRSKVVISQLKPLLKIQVTDNGVGFDASKIFSPREQSSGFGFFSMSERLNYLGGRLEVKSRPGRGSRIVLTVPQPGRKALLRKVKS